MGTHHYHAWLLRLWQTGAPGEARWRASLEAPHTRQVQRFADLDALLAFLKSPPDEPEADGAAAPDRLTEFMNHEVE